MLTSYKKRILQANQEKPGREWATVDPLAPQEKSDLPWKDPLRFKLWDLYMQVQGYQKETQWLRKIKSSDVHRQSYM